MADWFSYLVAEVADEVLASSDGKERLALVGPLRADDVKAQVLAGGAGYGTRSLSQSNAVWATSRQP